MIEFKMADCTITVMTNDITQVQAEAIVNPANSRLVMGGGVAGAIKLAGGAEIEREAVRKGPISVGEAVATTAGKLRARHVIHAPTMPRPAMSTDSTSVEKATMASLRIARELKLTSVAVPGMGTGVGGVPPNKAADAMIRAIKQHLSERTSLKRILLVSIDQELADAFASALRELDSQR
jgi:O-acetyl-ADP-ribose deacetylase (regulator of RNase III)